MAIIRQSTSLELAMKAEDLMERIHHNKREANSVERLYFHGVVREMEKKDATLARYYRIVANSEFAKQEVYTL